MDAHHLRSVEVVHTSRAVPLHHHAQRSGTGDGVQIAALARGVEEGVGGTAPLTVTHGDLVQARTRRRATIEIRRTHMTGRHSSIDKRTGNAMGRYQVGHRQRATRTVHGGRAMLLVFRLQKIRQHILPAPARVSQVSPMVVVSRVAPNVDHDIDGAGSTQHLPSWIRNAAQVVARL